MRRKTIIFVVGIVLVLGLGAYLLFSNNAEIADQSEELIDSTTVEKADVKMVYGIHPDSVVVDYKQIENGELLSNILLPQGVNYQQIDELVKKSKDVFEVRKIRSGNNYALLQNAKNKSLDYMVYEISAKDYVVFQFKNEIDVYRGAHEVKIKEKTIKGQISSSLWNDLVARDANPMLALHLSDVYQWTIDFFGLQKGDAYKIIYEEEFVNDKSIGLGRIKACWFQHASKEFYGMYFQQDSIGDYFDHEGQSMKRQFLKAPLKFSRISSKFSNSRKHPILKIRRPHHGVDYAAPRGTPVFALGDGKVLEVKYKGGYGKYIKIRHNSVYTTGYAHLQKYAKGIKPGVYVSQGELIGYVGSTGLSTGPHLDFRVYKNGKAIDPLRMDSPPAEPIDAKYKEAFLKLSKEYMKELNAI